MPRRQPSDGLACDNTNAAPFRSLNRVALVIVLVAAVVIGIAFAISAVLGGRTHGSTAPAPITAYR